MSWTVTMSGHCEGPTAEEQRAKEDAVIAAMRTAARESDARSAFGSFQHSGAVHLLDTPGG